MVTRAVRERLAQDIGGWLTDGLVSPEAHALLAKRYEARTFGAGQAVKTLGISGSPRPPPAPRSSLPLSSSLWARG
jgi:hypothetical protein